MTPLRATHIIVVISTIFGVLARAAGPVLTPEQIQAAIQKGSQYKTVDKFLDNGPKRKRIKLASAMAVDGISKYVTFFNDWQAVAAEAAAARQQMRELHVDDVQSTGLLHAYVEVHARGAIPTGKLNRRYGDQRAHLVLKLGERVIQPVEKKMIRKSDQSAPMAVLGTQEGKITLDFDFDVTPEDLQLPIEAILIDGDGNKHQEKADLKGILAFD